MDRRQPAQTMYEGAHRFGADAVARIRAAALHSLERYAPDPESLEKALGLDGRVAPIERVHARIVAKLEREPLEDYRLDFEDGYGNHPDAVEDAEARRGAREIARAMQDAALPPAIGIRVKPLTSELRRRSLRTFELFTSELVEAAGELPPGFVVTLPKISAPEEAADFADALERLESRLGLAEGSLRFEFMIELPQIVLGADGRSPLRRVLELSRGRAVAAHFGTYDYTAASGISAAHQAMHHPVCEFAKQMMIVAYAGTGLWLSDGSTNLLPIAPHPDDAPDESRARANRAAVHAAWRRHYDDVTGSLQRGFYQGWDLHPAQLVTRYAALYVFFLSGLERAAGRLRNALEEAVGATTSGALQDDPATGQALLTYLLRGIGCGALTEGEALQLTGLSSDELSSRSFATILAARAAQGTR